MEINSSFQVSGPAIGAFNGLHRKSKFLVIHALWLLCVILGSAASAQRVNLAKFQPATASSVNTSYFPPSPSDPLIRSLPPLGKKKTKDSKPQHLDLNRKSL